MQLKPVWEALAAQLAGSFKVGAVNCETNKALCAQYGIAAYPSIKLFRGGGSVSYDGERGSAQPIATWAYDALPTAQLGHLSPRRPETLDAFLGGPCGARAACVLLFHADPVTPAWVKTLSFAHRSTLAFAEARGPGVQDLAAALGAAALPAAVVVCGGDRLRSAPLPLPPATPALDHKAVAAFVEAHLRDAHAAAAFCAGVGTRQRPPLGGDYAAMRVGALRALLASRGRSCALCVEKADFVAELRALEAEERGTGMGGAHRTGSEL